MVKRFATVLVHSNNTGHMPHWVTVTRVNCVIKTWRSPSECEINEGASAIALRMYPKLKERTLLTNIVSVTESICSPWLHISTSSGKLLRLNGCEWLPSSPSQILTEPILLTRFPIIAKIWWNFYEVTAIKFCTCRDSTAVVACAKICSNMITKKGITAQLIFHQIAIMNEKCLQNWSLDTNGMSWAKHHQIVFSQCCIKILQTICAGHITLYTMMEALASLHCIQCMSIWEALHLQMNSSDRVSR